MSVQGKLESDPTNSLMLVDEKGAMEEYFILAKNEEESLTMKSRMTWLNCGDKNIKYFDTMKKIISKTNIVHSIENNEDIWIIEQKEFKKEFENYYHNIFNGEHLMQGCEYIFPKRELKNEVVDWLQRPFEDNEIFLALKLCGREKAPGPKGFSVAFYLDNWEAVKHDAFKAVKNFFKTSKMLLETNLTQFCLNA